MDEKKIGRRTFLRLSAMAAAGAAVVACQPQTVIVRETVQVEKEVTKIVAGTPVVQKVVETKEVIKEVTKEVIKEKQVQVAAVSARQSPMLQDLIKAGKLAPLEERLPVSPLVETKERNESVPGAVDLQIGKFGGIVRDAYNEPTFDFMAFLGQDEPMVSGPGIQGDNVAGNVVEGFDVSNDQTTFTFRLRKGMKWSDGTPVSTEDIKFTWEDILNNDKVTPNFPQYLRDENSPSGEPGKLEILDDATFRLSFKNAYGGIPMQLAICTWKGYSELMNPAHYLKPWHAKYTALDKLEPEIQKAGLAKGEWWNLFSQKWANNWNLTIKENLNHPTLNAWAQTDNAPTMTKYTRNMYYFKVDAEGNQIPYIDYWYQELTQNLEASNMKVITGEADVRFEGGLQNLALFKDNQEKGKYDALLLNMHRTNCDPRLNLTYKDENWRKVVRDVRFRQALNMAINRQEVLETVSFGQAEMTDVVPTEYDPEKAKKLLDDMGMSKKDADGFRLGPDGKTFTVLVETGQDRPDFVPVGEFLVEYWNAIGVKTSMKVIEGGLLGTRTTANETQCTLSWSHWPQLVWGGPWGELCSDGWGRLWYDWLTSGGKQGEEPPDIVKRDFKVVNDTWVANQAGRAALSAEHKKILTENLWEFHMAKNYKDIVTIKRGLKNVPQKDFGLACNRAMELFYWEK